MKSPSKTNKISSTFCAALSGGVGALLMTVVFVALRALRLTNINWELGLGSVLFHSDSFGAWVGGFVLHLINGVLLGLVFNLILRKLEWGGMKDGAILGFVQWFLTSMMIAQFPALDMLAPLGTHPAGPFGAYHGSFTFYALLVVHLMFGAIVGYAIGEPARLREKRALGWR